MLFKFVCRTGVIKLNIALSRSPAEAWKYLVIQRSTCKVICHNETWLRQNRRKTTLIGCQLPIVFYSNLILNLYHSKFLKREITRWKTCFLKSQSGSNVHLLPAPLSPTATLTPKTIHLSFEMSFGFSLFSSFWLLTTVAWICARRHERTRKNGKEEATLKTTRVF